MSKCRVSWKTRSCICPAHSVFCWLSSNWNWINAQHALRRWIGSSRKWRKRMKPANDSRRFPEPGVGPVTATALISAVGNGSTFEKGRNLAAWLGIVPGEYSTGGKQKLLGISKRGNKYLRRLFVQGARSVLQQRHKQAPGLSSWLAQLLARAYQN